MKNTKIIFSGLFIILMVSACCPAKETASEILQTTINSIDTIHTISFKQDMSRTNPRNVNDTIVRFREMFFKRLLSDSIVGVKGHWYMYVNDREHVIYEDIYDGNKLIRKNNRDSVAMIYDLIKYPQFKKIHFWSHNTLYGMQYEFRYILANADLYSIKRTNDTAIDGKLCFQIVIELKDKISMPGFATMLEDNEGSVSKTRYFIEKKTFYPVGMKGENYSEENPEQKVFISQTYYDIKFNSGIDEEKQFNTSENSLQGFKISEIIPE